jgi:hypothetical protein
LVLREAQLVARKRHILSASDKESFTEMDFQIKIYL